MCVACAARLIAGTYRSAEEVCGALGACFKLNSVQVRALLAPLLPPDLVDAAAAHARARADELYRADGREVGHRCFSVIVNTFSKLSNLNNNSLIAFASRTYCG